MKKVKIIAIIVWVSMLVFTVELATAQGFDKMDNEVHDISYYKPTEKEKPQVKVTYGRPITKKDTVFGTKVPFGKLWRTGSNEATEIKFYQDLMFGNIYVEAGTYVLYTIPNENYWTIILNSKTDTFGTFFYEPEKDIARIEVPVTDGRPIDIFSIGFNQKYYGTQMVLAWGKTRVKIPLYTEQRLLTKV